MYNRYNIYLYIYIYITYISYIPHMYLQLDCVIDQLATGHHLVSVGMNQPCLIHQLIHQPVGGYNKETRKRRYATK